MPDTDPTTPPTGDLIDRFGALRQALKRQDMHAAVLALEACAQVSGGGLPVVSGLLQAAATYRCAVALEQIGLQLQLLLERDR